MNTKNFIDFFAKKAEITKKDAAYWTDTFIDTITEAIENGEEVSLHNFGKFEIRDVPEKTGVINVGSRKGETFKTPARKKVAFKPSKVINDKVN